MKRRIPKNNRITGFPHQNSTLLAASIDMNATFGRSKKGKAEENGQGTVRGRE